MFTESNLKFVDDLEARPIDNGDAAFTLYYEFGRMFPPSSAKPDCEYSITFAPSGVNRVITRAVNVNKVMGKLMEFASAHKMGDILVSHIGESNYPVVGEMRIDFRFGRFNIERDALPHIYRGSVDTNRSGC